MKEAKQDAGLLFRIRHDEKSAADFKSAAIFGKTPGQSKVRGPVKSGDSVSLLFRIAGDNLIIPL